MIRAIQITTAKTPLAPTSLPSLVAESLPDTRVRDALRTAGALPDDCSIRDAARELGCSGYVVHSVPLAVFAAQRIAKTGLRELLVAVVEAGGDTDTNAALVGQIAGAFVGADGIGPELRGCVADVDLVVRTALELAMRMTG